MIRSTLAVALLTLLAACGGAEDECTADTHSCDGDILRVCVDGAWEEEEDCSAAAQICHDMGDDSHCMTESSMTSM